MHSGEDGLLSKELDGKIAIVTGASSGIGRTTAKLFADQGAKVALIGRNKNALEEALKSLPEKRLLFPPT